MPYLNLYFYIHPFSCHPLVVHCLSGYYSSVVNKYKVPLSPVVQKLGRAINYGAIFFFFFFLNENSSNRNVTQGQFQHFYNKDDIFL